MNFKDLREANLSKAQINKVHDKADDLPKSDFIKRYGKNGDAVRFATATNQVKKELGLEAYTSGPGTSRGRQSDGTYPSYWDPQAIPITLPTGAELRNRKPKSLLKRIFSDLDKEDEKSVGRVVKGLKKAVKAHQGQVDALTKDIKDETELDEFIAPLAKVVGKAAVPVAKVAGKTALAVGKVGGKLAYKGAKLAVKKGTPIVKKGVKVAIKKGTPIVKKVGKEVGKAALDVAVDVGQGVGDLAKKGAKAAAAVKQKTKDKEDVQRLLDRQKRLRAVARRNEEVVTEAVSDAYVKQIAKMTDNNDHFGARIELSRMMRDKELMQMYDSLEKMHRMNLGGNDALTLRSKLDKNLKFRLTQKVKKDADRLMGAL